MKLVVRRRPFVMATITLLAAAVSGGYVWRFSQASDWLALLIATGLGMVAVVHAVAWTGSRSPLLVADDTGLLVRGAGGWQGVPWESVERVEVRRRGWLSDGRLIVSPAFGVDVSGPRSWWSRLAAAVTRRGNDDDTLVVAFGLTTSTSEPDVATALRRLADGRTLIVIPAEAAEPEQTVELATVPAPAAASDSHAGRGPADEARTGAPQSAPVGPLVRVVSALASRPAARREEVLVARGPYGTEGALALSPRPEPAFEADTLPEIAEFRRSGDEQLRTDEGVRRGSPPQSGNVALIIDATTDLSARAMQKVRRPAPAVECPEAPAAQPMTASQPAQVVEQVIGSEITEARQRLGLSTDELAERTRIRAYVIESIEADNFGPCGGDFYARGHLRMLAKVLGLDPEPLVASYDKQFATSPIKARDVFEVELAAGTTGMVRGGDSRANWGALAAAVLALLLLWGLASFFADPGDAAANGGQPPQNAAGLGSPVANDPRVPPPLKAHVKVIAREGDARVVVEDRFGQVVFDRVVRDGTSKRLEGESPLRVSAADGGVIALSYRGQDHGLMSDPGEHARQIVRAPTPELTGPPA